MDDISNAILGNTIAGRLKVGSFSSLAKNLSLGPYDNGTFID
jgi:hypothetical protein